MVASCRVANGDVPFIDDKRSITAEKGPPLRACGELRCRELIERVRLQLTDDAAPVRFWATSRDPKALAGFTCPGTEPSWRAIEWIRKPAPETFGPLI